MGNKNRTLQESVATAEYRKNVALCWQGKEYTVAVHSWQAKPVEVRRGGNEARRTTGGDSFFNSRGR